MKARIVSVIEVDLDTDVPDLEFEKVPGRRDPTRTIQIPQNEAEVLKARTKAAKEADAVAKAMKGKNGVLDAYVMEVVD